MRDFKVYEEAEVFPPEMKQLEAYFGQSQIDAKKREVDNFKVKAKNKGK